MTRSFWDHRIISLHMWKKNKEKKVFSEYLQTLNNLNTEEIINEVHALIDEINKNYSFNKSIIVKKGEILLKEVSWRLKVKEFSFHSINAHKELSYDNHAELFDEVE